MASLFKVLLILSSAIMQQISFTPPNVPPSKEIIHQTYNEWASVCIDCFYRATRQAIYRAVSFAEIATIISHTTDSLSVIRVIKVITQYTIDQKICDTPITLSFILGTALAAGEGLIRWRCYCTLGRFFTFQLTQCITHIILHASPTSWLRHSGLLDIPGFKFVVVEWLPQITLLMINFMYRVSQEDEALESAFGDKWERWPKAGKYRLIPGVY
ncbi:hypothetical protein BDR07DRAFT_1451082 [Suillus spraguei]|nr:hypothetical protein BDR07DRAFT_1451082 [Suillus spraguei]